VLREIDETLEALFRASVPLAATDVDVSFESPDRVWSAKLNRPTVNCFLWDIRKSTDRARAGLERYERDGQQLQRMALPRVELRYLVTAWARDITDSHDLLGGLLRAVLTFPVIPADFLPARLLNDSLPQIKLVLGETAQIDLFKAIEGQLKPGLDVVVSGDVDLVLEEDLAPTPSVVDFGVGRTGAGWEGSEHIRRVAGDVLVPDAVGVQVVSPRGSAVVNSSGRFLVAAAAGDELSLLTVPVRTVVVPEHGGVVIS